MAWTPAQAVLNARAIPDNLLTFVTNTTQQTDALTYFGGSTLKLIKTFSSSVANRLIPAFPAIAFVDDNDAEEIGSDVLTGAYRVVFEVMVQNADPDTCTTQARIYSVAIKSMIANIPHASLIANTGASLAVLQEMESGFDEIKAHEDRKNDWMQRFQITAIYTLHAQAHI